MWSFFGGRDLRRAMRWYGRVAIRRYLKARVQMEFFENVVDVAFDSIYGKIEPCGDLFVAHPSGDQIDLYAVFANAEIFAGVIAAFFKFAPSAARS